MALRAMSSHQGMVMFSMKVSHSKVLIAVPCTAMQLVYTVPIRGGPLERIVSRERSVTSGRLEIVVPRAATAYVIDSATGVSASTNRREPSVNSMSTSDSRSLETEATTLPVSNSVA